jgi:hypothetical protein
MATLYTGGCTVTFSGGTGISEITRITVNKNATANNRQRVSVAHLGSLITSAAGTVTLRFEEPYLPVWQPTGGGAPNTVDVDFFGSALFAAGKTGSLTIDGPLTVDGATATIVSSTCGAAVGDLVRGSVSISYVT